MRDILFLAIVVGFFGASTLMVKACELLVTTAEQRNDDSTARR
jgi:hypothetical protein